LIENKPLLLEDTEDLSEEEHKSEDTLVKDDSETDSFEIIDTKDAADES
jgi:hypothetical protein